MIHAKFPTIPEKTPPEFRQLIEGCRSAPDTRPTASTVLAQLATWTNPAPQHALPFSQNEEIKNETPIPDNYQGALASGNFLVDSARPQNLQSAPSVRGALQDYRGAMFSNRGVTSQASERGQASASNLPASRGRASPVAPPSQRGDKPSNQSSCRHQ